MGTQLLAPAAVLILWTIIMLVWMGFSRFSAVKAAKLDLSQMQPGGRGGDLEKALPPAAAWKSHNYTHLLEQPTLFYAVVVLLHLSGGNTGLTVGLAWAYVALRIVHSLWQALVNRVPIRFALFAASTLCLLALSVLAVIATLG